MDTKLSVLLTVALVLVLVSKTVNSDCPPKAMCKVRSPYIRRGILHHTDAYTYGALNSTRPALNTTRNGRYCIPKTCCGSISEYLQTHQFESLFSKRNSPEADAVGFWDYQSFITASVEYQPYGFGTTDGKRLGTKEVVAFLGHVGSKTSCGDGVATSTGTRGTLAWGLCTKKEKNPSGSNYCDERYKDTYPCTPGVSYYGRGALPIYWNYNYGEIGKALNVDLLNHPEYIEQNATLAFQAAIWRWMTPINNNQPSAHEVFVGSVQPTKNDTLAKRVIPGFGTTMNVLYGDLVCGKGDENESMNNIISHYLYYLDLMGLGREAAGPHEVLTCAEQVAFNPTSSSSP